MVDYTITIHSMYVLNEPLALVRIYVRKSQMTPLHSTRKEYVLLHQRLLVHLPSGQSVSVCSDIVMATLYYNIIHSMCNSV